MAHRGVQQEQRRGGLPWIGMIVDVIGDPVAVAGCEAAGRHAVPLRMLVDAGSRLLFCQQTQRSVVRNAPELPMIIDRIDPIALRIPVTRSRDATNSPAAPSDALYMVLCRVTTPSGLTGYGECRSNRL